METKDILKTLRKSKGFANMKEFCEVADISVNTYQNYESGKRMPTAEMLLKIADFYDVTTDYLLGREPAPNPFADFNLSVDDEAEVAAKYMSLPPEIRACLLDVLIQLGDAAKKRHSESVQSNAQKQIKKSDTYNSELAVARSSNSDFLNVPDDETQKEFTIIEPNPDF